MMILLPLHYHPEVHTIGLLGLYDQVGQGMANAEVFMCNPQTSNLKAWYLLSSSKYIKWVFNTISRCNTIPINIR